MTLSINRTVPRALDLVNRSFVAICKRLEVREDGAELSGGLDIGP